MKIANNNLENFCKKPDDNIKAVLLYGADAGLISARSRDLMVFVVKDISDPFRIVQFSFDDIKDEPSRLADEINAISLMGGRRFIRVSNTPAAIPEEISSTLLSTKSDTLVVFEAGELAATSSFRKFFETEASLAALPCYKDDVDNIKRIIELKLRTEGFIYDFDAVSYIAGSFGGDRMVILSELEKLIIYMGNDKKITLDAAINCIGDNAESSLDDLCLAVASRDLTKTEKNLARILNEGIGTIAPIRMLLRYFYRLQQARDEMNKGKTDQQAMAILRPPVFFKQVDLFKSHLKIWNSNAIEAMIEALVKLEADSKQTGSPAELILSRFLCASALRKKS